MRDRSRSMRKLMVLLMLGAALELGACGGDPLDRDPDPRETTPLEAEKGPDKSRGRAPPRKAGVTSAAKKRRLIYLDARTLCGRFGVKRIVRTFDVEGGNVADVARSYAKQNYSAPFREAGYRGCLAGFEK